MGTGPGEYEFPERDHVARRCLRDYQGRLFVLVFQPAKPGGG